MNDRFDSADPAVGGRVPDITVYDADGAPRLDGSKRRSPWTAFWRRSTRTKSTPEGL
jgi:hypothetical protein